MHRRSYLTLLSAAAVTALAAGCSTGPTGSEESAAPAAASSAANADAGAYPVTIKHALGTTTVKGTPKRIATVGWSDADVALSLGVVPVAATAIDWGGNKNRSTDWFDKKLAQLGGQQPVRYSDADGAPIDEVNKARPDLILATNSGLTKDEYAKLSRIAPVVAYPGAPYGTSWQQSVDLIGKAVGRANEAKAVTASTESSIKNAVAKYPQLKGKTAAWIWFTPTDLSKFGAYTPLDNRPRMLESFGLKTAPAVTKAAGTTNSFSVDISAEKASTVDADVAIFDEEKPGQDATIRKNPLLGKMPALASGAYFANADQPATLTMSSPTPLSIPVGLQTFLPKLAEAASKAK
ncbi:ABC transporter substrate-binding protein [Luteipulveratus flavus]|uniref:ABC transporter substrate-binding protein n=1 Tax=Luteipulveratus flavus TaxID=3031728 RepID=A0ABT6CAI3_9MICO|nr:ABC transporter substrate-binding protein [Luteipulveratus sp. YIM 133296]MDF8265910.1 ABC transporter substrate-binding protein [Luteipulveratus sp. YIM 133296]